MFFMVAICLQNYTHAEDAFTHVLKLDMKCIDAKHELNEVRIQQLIVRVVILFIFSGDLWSAVEIY